MPKKVIFYPYNIGSHSARVLCERLKTKRVRENGKYKYFPNHLIVNWGNSHVPKWWTGRVQVLNHPNQVALATNKIRTFRTLDQAKVRIPKWFTDIADVTKAFQENPKLVVMCRTILDGHSGAGIVVAQKVEELVRAPLYTVHVRHKREYRIHVFNGKVIDAVEKRKAREGVENNFIRSHDNGYIFCRENVVIPKDVEEQALAAIRALGLVFGAVDMAYREKEKEAFVLEINTAPGIEGQTVDHYSRAFVEYQNAL